MQGRLRPRTWVGIAVVVVVILSNVATAANGESKAWGWIVWEFIYAALVGRWITQDLARQ